ncbi:GAF domain-containing sensor histidine kinase [Candidatus Collierbacteria bacterium]|nr:GAF domain-containing sensor histidine kinase [Candidatus Collierbacteria bacterium]
MTTLLDKLYQTGAKFLTPLSLPRTYRLVVQEAVNLVGAEYGSIFLANRGNLFRAYSNTPPLMRIEPRSRGYTFKSYRSGETITLTSEEQKRNHPDFKISGIKSIIIIPLIYKNKSIGVLNLLSKKRNYFTKERRQIVKLISSWSTQAIIKARLYDEVSNALEARDMFISMAVHELRTPLTTISGYAQLIRRQYKHEKNGPVKDWLDVLLSESFRMSVLIKELLEIERIKSGKFNYLWSEVHLCEIIQRAIADLNVTASEHNFVHINKLTSKNDVVVGDFDKLLQVLINILNNAVKFSPRGSEIKLESGSVDSSCYINIADQGEGISGHDLGKVFDDFYKGGDRTKQGMGLGLFLSRKIIEDHKGQIEISSRLNEGTMVKIRLPKIKLKAR